MVAETSNKLTCKHIVNAVGSSVKIKTRKRGLEGAKGCCVKQDGQGKPQSQDPRVDCEKT